MKKVVVIDLDSKYEYVNKYDDNKMNDELHQYILDSLDDLKKEIVLRVKFNYDISEDNKVNVLKMFKNSFKEELANTKKELNKLIFRDIILMILGFVFLIIYCYLDKFDVFLFSEFFLVISWVAFWEMTEGWLFNSKKLRIIKEKYRKLLLAKIEFVD